MPIYEYQCQNCGKRTEQLQRMDDPPLAACPQCGGPVKKLLSAPAVQFKGSGWYVTDYAGKKGGGAGAESKGESGGAAGSVGESSGSAAKESKDSGSAKESKESKDSKESKPAAKSGSGGSE